MSKVLKEAHPCHCMFQVFNPAIIRCFIALPIYLNDSICFLIGFSHSMEIILFVMRKWNKLPCYYSQTFTDTIPQHSAGTYHCVPVCVPGWRLIASERNHDGGGGSGMWTAASPRGNCENWHMSPPPTNKNLRCDVKSSWSRQFQYVASEV